LFDYFLNDKRFGATEKAHALPTHHRTVRALLPETGQRKFAFTAEEVATSTTLQRPELVAEMTMDIEIVDVVAKKQSSGRPRYLRLLYIRALWTSFGTRQGGASGQHRNFEYRDNQYNWDSHVSEMPHTWHTSDHGPPCNLKNLATGKINA
jgi:hypothetical protein